MEEIEDIKDIKWRVPQEIKDKLKKVKREVRKMNPHLENIITSFSKGGEKMVRCEKVFRKSRRATLLKNPTVAKKMLDFEKIHHDKSISHIKNAISSCKSFKEKFNTKLKEEINKNLRNKEKIEDLNEKIKEQFDELLLESDFNELEIKEILDIYNEELLEIEKNDFDGIIDHLSSRFNELLDIRSDEKRNRGRDYRSPLQWWKYFYIIGVVGLTVFVWLLAQVAGAVTVGTLKIPAWIIAFGVSAWTITHLFIILAQGC